MLVLCNRPLPSYHIYSVANIFEFCSKLHWLSLKYYFLRQLITIQVRDNLNCDEISVKLWSTSDLLGDAVTCVGMLMRVCVIAAVAWRVKKAVVAETPAHKQGHSLAMRTEQRRRRMRVGPTDTVVAESPLKHSQDTTIPSSLPASRIMRRSSFYSGKPSRSFSKYAKLEERMTQKVMSPPSRKFDGTYVAGSWLTSPRRITPKALLKSLLSPSPSDKTGADQLRRLQLKSPMRTIVPSSSLNFKSPVAKVGSPALYLASPARSAVSSLSQLGLDSPSRNTRSHASTEEKQMPQSETAVTRRPETLASPSSLGRRYKRIMSQTHGAVASPDVKQRQQRFPDGSQSPVAETSQSVPGSCDAANQIPAYLPERLISSASTRRAQFTECAKTLPETLHSDAVTVMKNVTGASSHIDDRGSGDTLQPGKLSSKKKCHSDSQSLPSTFATLSKSVRPIGQSVNRAGSDCYDTSTLISHVEKSDPHFSQNSTDMSHKRKKSGDKEVIYKLSPRKRPRRQLNLDLHSFTGKQHLSTVAAEQSEESAVLTSLFGCDTESHVETRDCAVVCQAEKLNSDVLQHLGSSGVESECSSNDADLAITQKYQLYRKRSSGFQSLGHISETERSSSPVFPTVSQEPIAVPSDPNVQHAAGEAVSVSPVFGKRKTLSSAGESPCVSLSGSGRKRMPVSGCAESFSPDVSQCSIAHLMTSPLLDESETQKKTGRNRRPSTRRCLDQQMYQSVRRHSSSKLTDEDF